jgi:hypothetical protein
MQVYKYSLLKPKTILQLYLTRELVRYTHFFLVLSFTTMVVGYCYGLRLISISLQQFQINRLGTVGAIDLKCSQMKNMELLHMDIGLRAYCSTTTTMVAESGTKLLYQERSKQLILHFRRVNNMSLSIKKCQHLNFNWN